MTNQSGTYFNAIGQVSTAFLHISGVSYLSRKYCSLKALLKQKFYTFRGSYSDQGNAAWHIDMYHNLSHLSLGSYSNTN